MTTASDFEDLTMRLSRLIAAALFLPTGCAIAQAPSFAALDRAIDRAVGGQRIVGAVVLVAHRGTLVYHRAAGFADRERDRPMREDAIFRLASVTKPMVAAAAMSLVDDGTLSLAAPVTRWLPDFQPRLPDGRTPTLTLEQLLSHTAGLSYAFLEPRDGPYRHAGVSDGLDAGPPLDENLRRIAGVPLAYAPGTGWRYSVAMDVVGAVLQSATGRALPDIVRERVTGPLGMADTGFAVADPQRLVTPYRDGPRRPLRMTDPYEMPSGEGSVLFHPGRALDAAAFPSGGAGMVGTAPDFMRFLLALLSDGPRRILAPETVASMRRDRAGPGAQTQGPGWGFGIGAAVLVDRSVARTPQAEGTWQWGGVYGHYWFHDPVADIAVVAFTNTTAAGMSGPFPDAVRDAVYAALRPAARRQERVARPVAPPATRPDTGLRSPAQRVFPK